MSEWPEPVREPGETPRWLGWTIAVALFGGLLWAVREDAPAIEWRMPEFAMPEMELPEINWPDFASNEPDAASAQDGMSDASEISEASAVVPGRALDIDMQVVDGVPFETCVGAITQTAAALGPATIIEDGANRRIVRFKTLQGDLTMSCVDGTMRMEQG